MIYPTFQNLGLWFARNKGWADTIDIHYIGRHKHSRSLSNASFHLSIKSELMVASRPRVVTRLHVCVGR